MAERRAELLTAVGEELGVIRSARDGDIGHTVVEQVFCSKLRVHVDKDAVGGLSLAGVAGYAVAMVKVRMLHRTELHLAAVKAIEIDGAGFVDRHSDGKGD